MRIPAARLPAVPLVAAALLLGLLVPFLMAAESRPTELTAALARSRLREFEASRTEARGGMAPSGTTVSQRPSLAWPAVEGAKGYRVRLVSDDGSVWVGPLRTDEPRYLLRPPGRLEAGRAYRIEVQPLLEGAEPMTQTFAVAEPAPELAEAVRRIQEGLSGAEESLALAGLYASSVTGPRRSTGPGAGPDDVASALEAYVARAPDGADAELAHSVLSALGRR